MPLLVEPTDCLQGPRLLLSKGLLHAGLQTVTGLCNLTAISVFLRYERFPLLLFYASRGREMSNIIGVVSLMHVDITARYDSCDR